LSEIRANTISDAAGTGPVTLTKQSAAKAWVNFNGTGTIAARDSFNLSSLTDNSTGNYTVNFTSSFNAGDYSAPTTATNGTGIGVDDQRRFVSMPSGSILAASLQLATVNPADNAFPDSSVVLASAHGDLA
jgi:hypothetical protein